MFSTTKHQSLILVFPLVQLMNRILRSGFGPQMTMPSGSTLPKHRLLNKANLLTSRSLMVLPSLQQKGLKISGICSEPDGDYSLLKNVHHKSGESWTPQAIHCSMCMLRKITHFSS